MKKLLFITILFLSIFLNAQQKEVFYEGKCVVIAVIEGKALIVSNYKRFWVKNKSYVENREYFFFIKIVNKSKGSRINAEIVFSNYSDSQANLIYRSKRDSISPVLKVKGI
jgi:hypothetical protein